MMNLKPSLDMLPEEILPNLIFLHKINIFRYLIDHGANVAAVNNDAELPLDIAESDEMEDMLQQNITAQGKVFGCCVVIQ
jgi:hypothetical protein